MNFSEDIKGDWLILYPTHQLNDEEQEKIYDKASDSLMVLLGLKTISFRPGGSFVQTDSIFQPAGKWHLQTDDKKLFIRNAGKGFDFFQGSLTEIKNDTMRITENLSLSGQTIKITWVLKRITDKKHQSLFREDENWWRKKDAHETDSSLRRKVKAMLTYYSIYFDMVSKESSYFSQARVFLPFSYYQHGMGLKPFNAEGRFSQVFYDSIQAQKGHAILSVAMQENRKTNYFPRGDNFVIEYAIFLNQLAEAIKQ